MTNTSTASKSETRIIVGNIGNTTSEFAEVTGGALGSVCRLRTTDILEGLIPPEIQSSPDIPKWIATVVPDAKKLAFLENAVWVSPEACPDIDFSAVDTATIGADRVANIAAAKALLNLPALIIDCGTAITFELIDSSSAFCGGAILPGRALLRSALHSGTAQLPEVPLDCRVPAGPGTTTRDAMVVGLDKGVVGAVEAVRKHILLGLNESVKTYIVGGDADFFMSQLTDVEAVPANFTLRGVAAIAEHKARG